MSTSNNAYFSPQTAFYDRSMPGTELLSNNFLFKNVVEQGVKDLADKTMHILPNDVTIRIDFLDCLNFQLLLFR